MSFFNNSSRVILITLLFSSFTYCSSQSRSNISSQPGIMVDADSLYVSSIILPIIRSSDLFRFKRNFIEPVNYIEYGKDQLAISNEGDSLSYVFLPQNVIQDGTINLTSGYYIIENDFQFHLINKFTENSTRIAMPVFSKTDNKSYNLVIYDPSSKIIINDTLVMIQLIEKLDYPIKLKSELLATNGREKLGLFSISSDSLKFIRTVPLTEYCYNLSQSKIGLSTKSIICQSKESYFVAYNFLDTVYQFNMLGDLKSKISLPNELNFQYYNNESVDAFYTTSDLKLSKVSGHKNAFIQYDKNLNCLYVITTFSPVVENSLYNYRPSSLELDWFISIYDLNSNQWLKVIKFNEDMDYRDFYFTNKNIFVRDETSQEFKFKKYKY